MEIILRRLVSKNVTKISNIQLSNEKRNVPWIVGAVLSVDTEAFRVINKTFCDTSRVHATVF